MPAPLSTVLLGAAAVFLVLWPPLSGGLAVIAILLELALFYAAGRADADVEATQRERAL